MVIIHHLFNLYKGFYFGLLILPNNLVLDKTILLFAGYNNFRDKAADKYQSGYNPACPNDRPHGIIAVVAVVFQEQIIHIPAEQTRKQNRSDKSD